MGAHDRDDGDSEETLLRSVALQDANSSKPIDPQELLTTSGAPTVEATNRLTNA